MSLLSPFPDRVIPKRRATKNPPPGAGCTLPRTGRALTHRWINGAKKRDVGANVRHRNLNAIAPTDCPACMAVLETVSWVSCPGLAADSTTVFPPCTPYGVMKMLEHEGI